jgi:hypothetical protein
MSETREELERELSRLTHLYALSRLSNCPVTDNELDAIWKEMRTIRARLAELEKSHKEVNL